MPNYKAWIKAGKLGPFQQLLTSKMKLSKKIETWNALFLLLRKIVKELGRGVDFMADLSFTTKSSPETLLGEAIAFIFQMANQSNEPEEITLIVDELFLLQTLLENERERLDGLFTVNPTTQSHQKISEWIDITTKQQSQNSLLIEIIRSKLYEGDGEKFETKLQIWENSTPKTPREDLELAKELYQLAQKTDKSSNILEILERGISSRRGENQIPLIEFLLGKKEGAISLQVAQMLARNLLSWNGRFHKIFGNKLKTSSHIRNEQIVQILLDQFRNWPHSGLGLFLIELGSPYEEQISTWILSELNHPTQDSPRISDGIESMAILFSLKSSDPKPFIQGLYKNDKFNYNWDISALLGLIKVEPTQENIEKYTRKIFPFLPEKSRSFVLVNFLKSERKLEKETVQLLEPLLSSENLEIRNMVSKVLSEVQHPGVLDLLLEEISKPGVDRTRKDTLIDLLAKYRVPQARNAIIELIKNGTPAEQKAASTALARQGISRETFPEVLQLARDYILVPKCFPISNFWLHSAPKTVEYVEELFQTPFLANWGAATEASVNCPDPTIQQNILDRHIERVLTYLFYCKVGGKSNHIARNILRFAPNYSSYIFQKSRVTYHTETYLDSDGWEREGKTTKGREDYIEFSESACGLINNTLVNLAKLKQEMGQNARAIRLFEKSKEICNRMKWLDGVRYASEMIKNFGIYPYRNQKFGRMCSFCLEDDNDPNLGVCFYCKRNLV